MAAKEPAKPLDWQRVPLMEREQGSLRSLAPYWRATSSAGNQYLAFDEKSPSAGRVNSRGDWSPISASGKSHHECSAAEHIPGGKCRSGGDSFRHQSVEHAKKAAERAYATEHYGLSDADVEAVHHAWPEHGPARFIGMHPDQVKYELDRAHAAMNKTMKKGAWERFREHMNKADLGMNTDGQAIPKLGAPMPSPTIGGGGDPVLSDPKVKRFLQQLGAKMVEHQFDGAFKPGDRVIHPYLGLGKVIRVHDPAEADPQGGLLYDVRYPEFDIALNQIELAAVPPPPVNPIAVPIKSNMRAAIPAAPPHPALQATVAMQPFMGSVAQAQQEEKEAQMEAMKEGQDAESGDGDSEGGDEGGGSDDKPPFGKSEALTKADHPGPLGEWENIGGAYTNYREGFYVPKEHFADDEDLAQKDYTVVHRTDGARAPVGKRWEVEHWIAGRARGHLGWHATREEGQKAAERHYLIGQHKLKDHEVKAVESAWPEQGVHRFHGMHPDQVKHEVNRALEAFPQDPIEKAKVDYRWRKHPGKGLRNSPIGGDREKAETAREVHEVRQGRYEHQLSEYDSWRTPPPSTTALAFLRESPTSPVVTIAGISRKFRQHPKTQPAFPEEEKVYGIKKSERNAAFDAETKKINENAQKPENQRPHAFSPAEWTHSNGHPRCLRCGDEERIDKTCHPRPNYGLSPTGGPRKKTG